MLDRFPEALSLLQRGSLYVRQAQTVFAAISFSNPTEADLPAEVQPVVQASKQVPGLLKLLERAEVRTSKDWYTFTSLPSASEGGSLANSALLEKVVENISLQNARSIGKRSKKPRKAGPVFFDVAFNYIAPVVTDLAGEVFVTDASDETVITTDVEAKEQVESIRDKQGESSASTSEAQSVGRGLWGFFGRRK